LDSPQELDMNCAPLKWLVSAELKEEVF